jgi:hypothetical protein
MINFKAGIMLQFLDYLNEYKILVVSLEQNDTYENLYAVGWM